MIKGGFIVVGSAIYGFACSRLRLRTVLYGSIAIHATMTLWYLVYQSEISAIFVTAIEATTFSLAMLPLYDLAARATPRGSEALGYSVMMSVWNFTKNMSDLSGSSLYSRFGLTIDELVWVNVGTTAIVLIAVPFLPAALVDHKEGESLGIA
jgi:predicted MFS family arabinose efflux permease